MGATLRATMKYHYPYCFSTYVVMWHGSFVSPILVLSPIGNPLHGGFSDEPYDGHCQVGSLAGAAHLLKNNAGVLRATHRERKSRVEQKGKSCLDFDFQCEYKP